MKNRSASAGHLRALASAAALMAGLAAPAHAAVLAPGTIFDVRLFELHPTGDRNEDPYSTYGSYPLNWFAFGAVLGHTTVNEAALGGGRYRIDVTLAPDYAFTWNPVDLFPSYSGYVADWGDGNPGGPCDPDVPEDGWVSCDYVAADPTAGLRIGVENPVDLSAPFTLERALLSFEGADGFSASAELIDTPVADWDGRLADGRAAAGVAGVAGKGVHTVRLQLTGTLASAPAAVPEPAAWATMIVGFGLCGAQLRRRARKPDARGPAGSGGDRRSMPADYGHGDPTRPS